MYLPPPLRRRLGARDAALRAEGVQRGLARARARRRRDRFRYVFVVTYGRSGSTLVQGLLNTLPRTLVRGENGLYVAHLYRAHAALLAFREAHDQHDRRSPVSAFFGLRQIEPEPLVQAVNDVVVQGILGNRKGADHDVLGFKEVAWHGIEPEETAGFFDLMDDAFPGVRYVLNTRDIDAVVVSGFWKRTDEEEARRLVARVSEIQEHLRRTRPEQVLDVRYEVLTGEDQGARDAHLRDLGRFVTGAEVDDTLLAALHETMGTGHGPNPSAQTP